MRNLPVLIAPGATQLILARVVRVALVLGANLVLLDTHRAAVPGCARLVGDDLVPRACRRGLVLLQRVLGLVLLLVAALVLLVPAVAVLVLPKASKASKPYAQAWRSAAADLTGCRDAAAAWHPPPGWSMLPPRECGLPPPSLLPPYLVLALHSSPCWIGPCAWLHFQDVTAWRRGPAAQLLKSQRVEEEHQGVPQSCTQLS